MLLLALCEIAHLVKIFIIFLLIIKYIGSEHKAVFLVDFKLSLEKFAPLVLELSFAQNMAKILSWGPATWFSGFNVFRSDRIFIKDDILVKTRSDFNNSTVECLWMTVRPTGCLERSQGLLWLVFTYHPLCHIRM